MASGGGVNTDKLSAENSYLLCTMCKHKGKNGEAEIFCMDCQDYYCSTCVKVHQEVPLLYGHKILDQVQDLSKSTRKMLKRSSAQQHVKPTERCDRHIHYYIDMYCQNHDDVGCATCMAVDHRSCKDIFFIPEFLQNNTSTFNPKQAQEKLDDAIKMLNDRYDNLQCQKEHVLKEKPKSLENISKFRKEINDRLDMLEKVSVDKTERLYKTLIHEIEEALSKIKTNKSNASSAHNKMATTGKNVIQDFVNAKKGKQTADTAARCTEDIKTQHQEADIDFTADKRLSALLEEMNALGVNSGRNAASASAGNGQKHSNSRNTTERKKLPGPRNFPQKDTLLQTRGSKKYSVTVKSDKNTCCIGSACTLEDGTIILSDIINNRLKLLDSSTYTVKDYCDLPWQPWQVCTISKKEAAVCLMGEHVVQLISVGGRMKKSRQIQTDFDCWGLAYAIGNLYISDKGSSVYIYSISGSKLKQLGRNKSGQELFSEINSLAVSKDGSKIYVSDFNKGLIVLDNKGQVVGKFNGLKLKHAYDCYLTDTGSLLVCGYGSNNVLQFGPNGKFIGEVLKGSSCKAVCCNQQMSKMIVSTAENGNIYVYDLI